MGIFHIFVKKPHKASHILVLEDDTCAEPEFKLWWMKLCSSDNHCTTALQRLWKAAIKMSFSIENILF